MKDLKNRWISILRNKASEYEHEARMITIIIPTRSSNLDVDTTLWSLKDQTFQDFKIIIVPDQGKGDNWARNEGAKMVDTEYLLFSDDDIQWRSYALQELLTALKTHPEASYAYGSWTDDRGELCFEEFDAEQLKKNNYISTMSLIRTKDFCGFDESIDRLQDWDLFLTLLEQGKVGVQCGFDLFTTTTGNGITNDSSEDYQKAKQIIQKKHAL